MVSCDKPITSQILTFLGGTRTGIQVARAT